MVLDSLPTYELEVRAVPGAEHNLGVVAADVYCITALAYGTAGTGQRLEPWVRAPMSSTCKRKQLQQLCRCQRLSKDVVAAALLQKPCSRCVAEDILKYVTTTGYEGYARCIL